MGVQVSKNLEYDFGAETQRLLNLIRRVEVVFRDDRFNEICTVGTWSCSPGDILTIEVPRGSAGKTRPLMDLKEVKKMDEKTATEVGIAELSGKQKTALWVVQALIGLGVGWAAKAISDDLGERVGKAFVNSQTK